MALAVPSGISLPVRDAHTTNARSRTENKDKKTQIIYCNKWQTQRWETFGMLQHMKSFPIG